MWIPEYEYEEDTQLNWVAILAFCGSVLFSLTVWVGIFRAVESFVG